MFFCRTCEYVCDDLDVDHDATGDFICPSCGGAYGTIVDVTLPKVVAFGSACPETVEFNSFLISAFPGGVEGIEAVALACLKETYGLLGPLEEIDCKSYIAGNSQEFVDFCLSEKE